MRTVSQYLSEATANRQLYQRWKTWVINTSNPDDTGYVTGKDSNGDLHSGFIGRYFDPQKSNDEVLYLCVFEDRPQSVYHFWLYDKNVKQWNGHNIITRLNSCWQDNWNRFDNTTAVIKLGKRQWKSQLKTLFNNINTCDEIHD